MPVIIVVASTCLYDSSNAKTCAQREDEFIGLISSAYFYFLPLSKNVVSS